MRLFETLPSLILSMIPVLRRFVNKCWPCSLIYHSISHRRRSVQLREDDIFKAICSWLIDIGLLPYPVSCSLQVSRGYILSLLEDDPVIMLNIALKAPRVIQERARTNGELLYDLLVFREEMVKILP